MKIITFLTFMFLISCGKSVGKYTPNYIYENNGMAFVESDLPLKFYVPRHRYEQFKAQFDAAESEFKSKSGKGLITFIPWNEDPKFKTYGEASSLYRERGQMWVLFKDYNDEFIDMDDKTAGLANYYFKDNKILYGNVFLNFTLNNWNSYKFGQALMHELGHTFGFDHTSGSDYSIMNFKYVYDLNGISYNDNIRLKEKYPFSLMAASFKDLEKIGAQNEEQGRANLESHLIENFGLSEDRALDVSKYLYNYNKIKQKRSLTQKEQDLLSQKILGFKYTKGKKALENYINGETKELEDLMEIAAKKNETTPEHIQNLLGEYFL